MSSSDSRKRAAAAAALKHVRAGMILGVGTGSTVNELIALLAEQGPQLEAAVSSSEASTERLRAAGIEVRNLEEVGALELYIDGADETNTARQLIKGGGGALTREKIIAEASETFICIVDDSKVVDCLGAFPLPIEVIPMARRLVAGHCEELGGRPVLREGFVTDNGNVILDVHDLQLDNPIMVEANLNQIPGVVTNGLFALRGADWVIVASNGGVHLIGKERAISD